MRDVKYKKWVLLLTISSMFFPSTAFGEERQTNDTNVGIGFREEQPAPADPSTPTPINDVLPLTMGKNYQTQADQPRYTSKGTLPQTGSQRQVVWLQFLGLGCIASCFWLFLFTRLREEEKENV